MDKNTKINIGIAVILLFLIWDFWDGYKGHRSMFMGLATLVGGIVSFLLILALLEKLSSKKDDDSGPDSYLVKETVH